MASREKDGTARNCSERNALPQGVYTPLVPHQELCERPALVPSVCNTPYFLCWRWWVLVVVGGEGALVGAELRG